MTLPSSQCYNCSVFLPKKCLPKSVERVLKVLSRHLVPPTEDFNAHEVEEGIIQGARRILFEFQIFYRWGFVAGILFFEWAPVLFGFGASRFTKLAPSLQAKYVDQWAASRLISKREFFKAIKGLVLVVYFSDKRVWKYIGYDPAPYLDDRIQLRGRLIGSSALPATKQEGTL